MNWGDGYSASYYLTILDKKTMQDRKRIDIVSGSVKRTLADLRESASIIAESEVSKGEEYIRVWLDTYQKGDVGHTPLFTGISTSPKDTYKVHRITNSLECYSVLKIAEDVLCKRGYYAPYYADAGLLIKNLLSVVPVKITVPEASEDTRLKQAIVSEGNENRLSMTDKILDAMNWVLRLDGWGNISIGPVDATSRLTIDNLSNDIIENEITKTYDWYNAPNCVRCILDNTYAEAKDESDSSPLSVQNRGREVWVEESDVTLGTNETLGEYAQRRLTTLQQVATSLSYSRRYWPDVVPGDCITIRYPVQDISGYFMVKDQSITLGANATTSEEVVQI